MMSRIERALISVSDKTGIVEFARALGQMGVEIVSTGGTYRDIFQAGIRVTKIDALTGFPEMLDGRVKTLHPHVHGGILFRRDLDTHWKTVREHGIKQIDLVVVNLYPFAKTVANPNVTLEDAIENIDIGGPAMVRSAAKNHDSVTVVVNPDDYDTVLAEMRANNGTTTLETRQRLMVAAYEHTAAYDALIGRFFRQRYLPDEPFPKQLTLTYERDQTCRYGENPHQAGALYVEPVSREVCVAGAKLVHGKPMSFNNLYDANAAVELIKGIQNETPAAVAVVIKHANPCGAATHVSVVDAYVAARAADTTSAYGGILAINRPLDITLVEQIFAERNFFEVIVAPSIDEAALEAWIGSSKAWAADCRLLELPGLQHARPLPALDHKRVTGGLLVQQSDLGLPLGPQLTTVTKQEPSFAQINDLRLAQAIVRFVKSNAIVLVQGGKMVGMGAGQPNRVNSVGLALKQAWGEANGAVMASDAYFPFPDGPEAAIKAGITAIIQPGGSKKDQETIDLCDEHKVAMIFTGIRHFLH